MKTVFKTSMLAAALSFGVVACDSAAENQAEDNIEAMEDTRDAQVDAMEDSGQITDTQADAMDDRTDATEDRMEDAVDDVDPNTPAEAAAATEAAR